MGGGWKGSGGTGSPGNASAGVPCGGFWGYGISEGANVGAAEAGTESGAGATLGSSLTGRGGPARSVSGAVEDAPGGLCGTRWSSRTANTTPTQPIAAATMRTLRFQDIGSSRDQSPSW